VCGWSTLHPCRSALGRHGVYLKGGWLVPRGGLDCLRRRENFSRFSPKWIWNPQPRAKYTDPLLVAGKVGNMLKICTKCRCSLCCCPHANTQSHTCYGCESTKKFHLWYSHRTWSSSLMLLMLSFPAKVARFLRPLLHPTTQLPTARSVFPKAFLATAWLGSHVCSSLCLPTALHSLRTSQPNIFTGCRCSRLRILPLLCAAFLGILRVSTSWIRVSDL
jgi:hypothetical protein